MKVDDLKSLSGKLLDQIKKQKAEINFQEFAQVLSSALRTINRQHPESVSQYKDKLFTSLRSFDGIALTYSESNLFAALGYGGLTAHAVLTKLLEIYKRDTKKAVPQDITELLNEIKPKVVKSKVSQGILVGGEGGYMVRLARCCNPVPGDAIVGYITRGRGITVHHAECNNVLSNREEYERMISVSTELRLASASRS